MARAYRDLQAEGLLESVRGMGLEVAEGAAERCRAARREIVRQRLRRAIEEARQSKMDPAEIEAILREEWARGHASSQRQCLRTRTSRREPHDPGTDTVTNGGGDPDSGVDQAVRHQTAVDGLSLSVPEGSIFGLLGENGAGKTTTIQTLLGLVKARWRHEWMC